MYIKDLGGLPKLSDVLFDSPSADFGTFAHLPCNISAVETALRFCAGRSKLAVLVGPSGWGKTHLMEATAFTLFQQYGLIVQPVTARQWISNPSRVENSDYLLIDDVQDALEGARMRQNFRTALERRVKSGKPTMLAFTASRYNRQIKSYLPQSRDWTIGNLPEATPKERIIVINQMSKREGLVLDPLLIEIMAAKMQGNGRTLLGALMRLRLASKEWLGDDGALKGLGTLNMFFADNSGWDLRTRIASACECQDVRKMGLKPVELSIYLMMRGAQLCESDVAHYYGYEPAGCYAIASKYDQILNDSQLCDLKDAVVRKIVNSLLSD